MPKYPTVRAFSAGGLVYRRANDPDATLTSDGSEPSAETRSLPEVVLVGRAAEDFWVLPKGTPAPNETIEEVALREVREESGVTARIVAKLGSIHYWFSRRGVRYSKEVFYFLMEATGGDVSLHDHEYDDARWFPLDDAPYRLAYENEAEIARRAASLLAGQIPGEDGRR